MIPSIPRNVEARLSVEVRKAPSLPEAKKEERRFVKRRRVAWALAVELGTYCGFKVKEGGDVPASHKRFTARYASGDGFVAAEVMEANVDCFQVVPRPEDVWARFGSAFVGGRE